LDLDLKVPLLGHFLEHSFIIEPGTVRRLVALLGGLLTGTVPFRESSISRGGFSLAHELCLKTSTSPSFLSAETIEELTLISCTLTWMQSIHLMDGGSVPGNDVLVLL
jgi:hypothetical protein